MVFKKSDTKQNSPCSEAGRVSPAPCQSTSVISPSSVSVYSVDTSSSSSSSDTDSDSSETSQTTPKEPSVSHIPATVSSSEICVDNAVAGSKASKVVKKTESISNVSTSDLKECKGDKDKVIDSVELEAKIPHGKKVAVADNKAIDSASKDDYEKSENASEADQKDTNKEEKMVQEDSANVRGELDRDGNEKSELEGSLPFEVTSNAEAEDSMNTEEENTQPRKEDQVDDQNMKNEG